MKNTDIDIDKLDISEKLALLDKLRRKAMLFESLAAIPIAVAFIAVLIGFFSGSFNESSAFFVILVVSILSAVVLGGIGLRFYNDYKKFYKQNFVKIALEGMFDDLVYNPNHSISRSEIVATHIIRRGNVFIGDDYISATYRGVPFVHSDITIQQRTSNGKNTTTTTYFKGKWMAFDFNKDFSEYVIIVEKGGNAYVDKKTNNKVAMESAEFNDKFKVYATDDHTAFYLITPQFLVNLEKLRANTHGQTILAFINGKLHIALHTNKNSLEPKLFAKVDMSVIESIRKEMKVVTDFLDVLAVDKPNFRTDKIDGAEDTNAAESSDPFDL